MLPLGRWDLCKVSESMEPHRPKCFKQLNFIWVGKMQRYFRPSRRYILNEWLHNYCPKQLQLQFEPILFWVPKCVGGGGDKFYDQKVLKAKKKWQGEVKTLNAHCFEPSHAKAWIAPKTGASYLKGYRKNWKVHGWTRFLLTQSL